MTVVFAEIEPLLKARGFQEISRTSKRVGYQKSSLVLYGSLQRQGTSVLVCPPDWDVSSLAADAGITSGFRRGDHMKCFPKGMDAGKGPGHYGRAFTFKDMAAVHRCLAVLDPS